MVAHDSKSDLALIIHEIPTFLSRDFCSHGFIFSTYLQKQLQRICYQFLPFDTAAYNQIILEYLQFFHHTKCCEQLIVVKSQLFCDNN